MVEVVTATKGVLAFGGAEDPMSNTVPPPPPLLPVLVASADEVVELEMVDSAGGEALFEPESEPELGLATTVDVNVFFEEEEEVFFVEVSGSVVVLLSSSSFCVVVIFFDVLVVWGVVVVWSCSSSSLVVVALEDGVTTTVLTAGVLYTTVGFCDDSSPESVLFS